MKNQTPFIAACSEAGKRGAQKRWLLHVPVMWTSLRVDCLVKNQILYSCHKFGFRSVNDYLHTLNSWGDKIMQYRQQELARRASKIF